MVENASQSIKKPWASGGRERPPHPQLLVPRPYGARWPFSDLEPVEFSTGSAPV